MPQNAEAYYAFLCGDDMDTMNGPDGKKYRKLHLRRSRDGTSGVPSFVAAGRTDGVPSSVRPSVGIIQFALGSF